MSGEIREQTQGCYSDLALRTLERLNSVYINLVHGFKFEVTFSLEKDSRILFILVCVIKPFLPIYFTSIIIELHNSFLQLRATSEKI